MNAVVKALRPGKMFLPHTYRIGAIDLGSNAVRLSVAETFSKEFYTVIKYSRKPLRLGESVFATGSISRSTMNEAGEYFRHFRDILWKYKVDYHLAVGTSALRDAKNQKEFLQYIQEQSGLSLQVISGEEEGQIIFEGISRKVDLAARKALLVDVGGGSVEFTYVVAGKRMCCKSYPIGTLRSLNWMRENGVADGDSDRLAQFYLPAIQDFRREHMGLTASVDVMVGTGGNCERYGMLNSLAAQNAVTDRVELATLKEIRDTLHGMDIEERMEEFKLERDRADVVVPAGAFLELMLSEFNLPELKTPGIGLRDGVLYRLASLIDRSQQP